MQIRAVIFDLDGTLLDTLDDLADSANAMLEAQGYPGHPVDAYKHFIGDGMAKLVERILPQEPTPTPALIEECLEAYQQEYWKRWNAKTRPYDGIPGLLDVLVERGVGLAVLSNKKHAFTEKCVEEFLSAWTWGAVLGQREGIPRKPDPAGAIEAAGMLGFSPGQCIYIGDSGVDMQTASRAGMVPAGALWGFRGREELLENGAKHLLERPEELLEFVEK